MIKIIPTFLFLAVLMTSPSYAIDSPRSLDWNSLVPEMAPLKYPFSALTSEQRSDLEFLISTHNMQQQGLISKVGKTFEGGVETRHKLSRQGLNVDKLLASFELFESKITSRNQMANQKLNGQLVRIPGYALPLEHKDTGVMELLLVPYVGACIHVPPPPANQTVYVRLKSAHILKDLYEPIWVTGRLSVKATKKSFFLNDGSASVYAAYTIDGIKIEPYEEPSNRP
jgi:hypothetical protein